MTMMSSDEAFAATAGGAALPTSLSGQDNSNVSDSGKGENNTDCQNEEQQQQDDAGDIGSRLEETNGDVDNNDNQHQVQLRTKPMSRSRSQPPPPPSFLSRETLACLKTTLAFVVIKRKWQKKHKIGNKRNNKNETIRRHHVHNSVNYARCNTAAEATTATATASFMNDTDKKNNQQQQLHLSSSKNNSFAHRHEHIEHMMQQALIQVRRQQDNIHTAVPVPVRTGLALHLASQISSALVDDENDDENNNMQQQQPPLSAVERAISDNSITSNSNNSTTPLREECRSVQPRPITTNNNNNTDLQDREEQEEEAQVEEEVAATTTADGEGERDDIGGITKRWIQATFLQPHPCQEATDMAMVWCAILQQTTLAFATVQQQGDHHHSHHGLILPETLYVMLTQLLQATIDEGNRQGECCFKTPALAISFMPVWTSALKQLVQQECVPSPCIQQQQQVRLREYNDVLASWLGLTPTASSCSTTPATFSFLTAVSLADCFLKDFRQLSSHTHRHRRHHHHRASGMGGRGSNIGCDDVPPPPVSMSSPLARVADGLFLRHVITSQLQKYWTPTAAVAHAPSFFCSTTDEEEVEQQQQQQQQQQRFSPTNTVYFSGASWPENPIYSTPDLPMSPDFFFE
jgi:hypothetical protein